VAPDAPLAIPLFEGALLRCVPCRETAQVLLALYGPRGGDAGGVVLGPERAAVLGAWLQRWAGRQAEDGAATDRTSVAPAGDPAALFDPEIVGTALATLAVPAFADWWALDVVAPRGRMRRLAIGHADPTKSAAAQVLRQYPPDPAADHPRAEVLRSGRPDVDNALADGRLMASARSTEHLAVMRALKCRAALCVPLVLRRRILGFMTFATAESGRRYDAAHVEGGIAFAKEAALALDGVARLRRAKAALQRKLDQPARPGTTGTR
jgi:hypothetical protein